MLQMTPKAKLDSDYNYDFQLLGLVSSVKEYVLAWHFNQSSILHFAKAPDIQIEFKQNARILISNFLFESEFVHVLLLRNRLVSSNTKLNRYLLPELQNFDYLIKFQSEVDEPNVQDVLELARAISVVQYVTKIEIDQIKSKENLLF